MYFWVCGSMWLLHLPRRMQCPGLSRQFPNPNTVEWGKSHVHQLKQSLERDYTKHTHTHTQSRFDFVLQKAEWQDMCPKPGKICQIYTSHQILERNTSMVPCSFLFTIAGQCPFTQIFPNNVQCVPKV